MVQTLKVKRSLGSEFSWSMPNIKLVASHSNTYIHMGDLAICWGVPNLLLSLWESGAN